MFIDFIVFNLGILGEYNPSIPTIYRAYIGISHRGTLGPGYIQRTSPENFVILLAYPHLQSGKTSLVYQSIYTPCNKQHVCPWKWRLGNGNYFLFGAKGLFFKGIRDLFFRKGKSFWKTKPTNDMDMVPLKSRLVQVPGSLFPDEKNPGIKLGRISSPRFDPKDSNPLVPEMDVQFLIYQNFPDTTQVSILKKKTYQLWLAYREWGFMNPHPNFV